MGEGERGPIACTPHACADEIVGMLLAAGANPNDTQGLYNTQFTDSLDQWLALFIAHGLKRGSPAWSQATFDYILAQAVTAGRLARVKLVLENGADPNVVNPYNKRSCHTNAMILGREDIAALLRAHGARVETLRPADEFRVAMRRADEPAMQALLADHPSLRELPELLREGAHYGIGRVLWLIDRGFDLNGRTGDGRTLLMDLALWGALDAIKTLLARGADPDLVEKTYGATALGFALHNRRWPVVEFLVATSNNIFDVCRVPHLERLRQLLARNPALVAERTPMGNTPLFVVSQARDEDIDVEASAAAIDLLLVHGADPAARNNEGLTPLEWYRKQGVDDMVDLLAARGAG
jgi:ankyrin repeat protein